MIRNIVWNVQATVGSLVDAAFDYLNEEFEGIMTGLVLVVIPFGIWMTIGYLSDWNL